MKFKLLKDIEIQGVIHKKGEIHFFDELTTIASSNKYN
jgi:hypothetical protein